MGNQWGGIIQSYEMEPTPEARHSRQRLKQAYQRLGDAKKIFSLFF